MTKPPGTPGAGGAGRGVDSAVVLGGLLIAVTVLLVAGAGTYAFHFNPAVRTTCAVVIGMLLAAWAIVAFWRRDLRPSTALAGPLLVASLAFGISVLASERPRLSYEPALIGVASVLTLLMLTSLLRIAGVRRLVGSTLIVGTLMIVAAYLIQVAAEWLRFWTVLGHFAPPPLRPSFAALTFGSPNLVATFMLLLGPLATTLVWQRSGARAGIPMALAAVLCLLLAGSRGGYLGLALAIVAGVGLLIPRFLAWFGSNRLRLGRQFGLAVGGSMAAAAAAAFVLAPSLLARLTLSGADLRFWYWRAATELFNRAPLTGTGPGTWAQLKIAEVLPTEANYVVPHAHSLFYQSIAEVGLLGVGALLIFGLALIWRARVAFLGADRFGQLQVIAVLASLAGLIGQQIPDYVMNVPAVVLVTGILIAWLDGMPRAVVHSEGDGSAPQSVSTLVVLSRRLGTPLALVLGAVLIASLPNLQRVNDAMWLADAANRAATDTHDWAGALSGYDQALALDPTFTLYGLERANALAHLGRLEEARAAYEAVVDEDLLPENVLSLAGIDLALGDVPGATKLADVALARGWRDPTVGLNAGRIFETAGDTNRALAAYAAAIFAHIPLAASDYWTAQDRGVTKAQVIDRTHALVLAEAGPGNAAVMAAYAGDTTLAARDIADLAEGPYKDLFQAVVQAISGDRAIGLAALRQRVERHPDDFEALSWLSRLTAADGGPEWERWATLASIERYDEAPDSASARSVVPAVESDRYLGTWTSYPFAVYSRRGPADLWAPQVLVIGITERP